MKNVKGVFVGIILLFLLYGCEKSDTKEKLSIKETPSETKEASKEAKKLEILDNDVYGKFVDEDFWEVIEGTLYRDEKKDLSYSVVDGTVVQIEKEFDVKKGLNKSLDEEFLTNHAYDHMSKDSLMIGKKSENHYIYESNNFGKKYEVIFQADNDDEIITRVIVSEAD